MKKLTSGKKLTDAEFRGYQGRLAVIPTMQKALQIELGNRRVGKTALRSAMPLKKQNEIFAKLDSSDENTVEAALLSGRRIGTREDAGL
jgi:hypothetical protein